MALSTDLVAALGWALLDFVWQGLVVGAIAAIALLMLRNARPQARYAVACLALGACLALPLLGTLRGLVAVDATPIAGAGASEFAPAFAVVLASNAPVAVDWRQSLQPQLPAIVAAWSAGALLLALRLLLGARWVGRLRAGARLPGAHWQGRCDELAVYVGLRAPVPLRLSNAVDGPVTIGWWRPMVLVPAALLAGMPADLLEALIAHELAHVRRRDYLVNLMQGAVETLLFYHPVVWWLSRQARVEREQIADDLASRAIGEPRRLALALQALDRIQDSGPARLPRAPGLVLAAQGGKLMSRIKRLLRPDRQRPDWKLALPLAGLAALGLAVHAAQATAPAAVAGAISTHQSANAPGQQSYAVVREGRDGMMLSGDLDDMADVRRLRQHVHGDFVWFRRSGEGYIVQDAGLLSRVNQAWGPAEAMSAKMEALSAQMKPHSERMEALSRQMESLSRNGEPAAREMEALSKRMEPLAQQQAELGEKMHRIAVRRAGEGPDADARAEASVEQLHSQMEALSRQMETLSQAMEGKSELMRQAHEPMEALSRQMEAAGKPMQALSQQLEVLAGQQEALTHEADAEVARLIEDALKQGKAVPARQLSK